MKSFLSILLALLVGAQTYTLYEVLDLKRAHEGQQLLDHERYLFFTDLHIYSLQVRETFDIFTKLTYARLLRLEGTPNMDATIKDLNTQYEKAAKVTEAEWKMLKAKHPAQIKEFALKYENWLKERESQG